MRIIGLLSFKNLLWHNNVKFIALKLSKINNLLKVICSRTKGPHIETAINICRSLTNGIIQHGITLYDRTSQGNINKIDVALNNCYRTATGLLRSTLLYISRNKLNGIKSNCRYQQWIALQFLETLTFFTFSQNALNPKLTYRSKTSSIAPLKIIYS